MCGHARDVVPRRPQAEYCGEYCGRCRTLPGVAVTVAHLEALKTFHWPTTPDLDRAKFSNVGGLFRSKYLERCTLYAELYANVIVGTFVGVEVRSERMTTSTLLRVVCGQLRPRRLCASGLAILYRARCPSACTL